MMSSSRVSYAQRKDSQRLPTTRHFTLVESPHDATAGFVTRQQKPITLLGAH